MAISRRNEMPQQPIWVEDRATKTNDAKVLVDLVWCIIVHNLYPLVDPMENNNNRTFNDLATPNPQLEPAQTHELKSGLIHLLSKFHGLVGEDPHKNLKEFHVRMFLKKFFLASRTTTIRKEICGIRQHLGETLQEYWERFNKFCTTCSHH
ncbi:hypothetical protein CR513_07955, partial [Mucuna pruriens]